ncbi:Hypothetical protein GLP15_84 [Giardia lamblia P15]|uniref:Uncharacterized protein n=1 Tax=Giardia intestinalis (strain P15) TaxID=658858 RepID=E1F8G3_GIAIA|nr:Hypothetical protein GLP15_84 [Giardia lamblia P15]
MTDKHALQRSQSTPYAPSLDHSCDGSVYQYGIHGHSRARGAVCSHGRLNMDYLHVRVSKMISSSRISAKQSNNSYSLSSNCSIGRGTDYISQQRHINTYSLSSYKSLPGPPKSAPPRCLSNGPGASVKRT